MDWGAVALLAAITWIDGVRRVPDGTLILRRTLGGGWDAVEGEVVGRGWRVASWWTPLSLALVLAPPAEPGADSSTGRAVRRHDRALAVRLGRVRRLVSALRVLGAGGLAALVVGVPAATARHGAWGFVLALCAVWSLAAVTALVAVAACRRSGDGWTTAGRTALPLLSPFAAPRAAEIVLARAAAGAPPVVVARRLLGPAQFACWARPLAYDVLHTDDAAAASAYAPSIRPLLGDAAVAALVGAPPAECGDDDRFCPRCARLYRAVASLCAVCDGVALRAPGARIGR